MIDIDNIKNLRIQVTEPESLRPEPDSVENNKRPYTPPICEPLDEVVEYSMNLASLPP